MTSTVSTVIAAATKNLLRSSARSIVAGSQSASAAPSAIKSPVPSHCIRASSTSIALDHHIPEPYNHPLSRETYHNTSSFLRSKISGIRSRSAEDSNGLIKPFEEIPAPKGIPILGTTLDLMKSGGAAHIHEYADMRHKQIGPIYREKLGTVEAVFIADSTMMQSVYSNEGKHPMHFLPEPWVIYNQIRGIQRGLFFMDGEHWSETRRALNQVFLKPNAVTQYTGLFRQVTDDVISCWSDLVKNSSQNSASSEPSAVVDTLEHQLYCWSIESLGSMIFGRRLGCVKKPSEKKSHDETTDYITDIVQYVQQIFVESAKMTMIPPKLAYSFNLPVWKRFVSAADKALSLAKRYVEQNVQEITEKVGSTNDVENEGGAQGILRDILKNSNLEQDQIVQIITDLFLAAADTTSHATQWALYLMAKHPESQERLLQEINKVTKGEEINEGHLANLPYVKGVIKEALRLYPVAPFLTRILDKELTLGNYKIPAGKLVLMSLYTTGRNEEYFADAENFKPERWLRTNQHSACPQSRQSSSHPQGDNVRTRTLEQHKHQQGHAGGCPIKHHQSSKQTTSHACLPFGMGVRSCIGRRVAEVQMQILLCKIIQNFHLQMPNNEEIGIKLRMITTPEKPISLLIKPRNPSQQL